MKFAKPLAALVLAASFAGLTACAQPYEPVIAPVTMEASSLQGETVELRVGQVLNVDTGDLAVDSYTGEVADPSVATFVEGREEDGTTFNPGVEGIAPGSTEVVMTNSDGGIEPLTFTVEVSE